MFDRYVAAQTHRPGSRRLQVLVIASVVVHAAGVVGLIAWSFAHVEEVAPPLVTVTFFSAAPPPPPPPPPPARRKAAERKPRPTLTQPRDVKPLVQPKEPEAPEPEDRPGAAGGVEGGVEGGVAGGVVGSPTPPPPPPAAPPRPKTVAKAPDPSEFVSQAQPHLPEAITIQRKGTGDADFFAKVCVDMEGRVTDITVKAGIPGADDSITRVIRTWQLKPQPIPICFPVRLTFRFE